MNKKWLITVQNVWPFIKISRYLPKAYLYNVGLTHNLLSEREIKLPTPDFDEEIRNSAVRAYFTYGFSCDDPKTPMKITDLS